MTFSFAVPSFDELEKARLELQFVLTLLPREIRHSVDTSGKAEKYGQPVKKVKFSDSPAASTTTANDEVKSRVMAKINELRSKRGGSKKEKSPPETVQKKKNKPSKVEAPRLKKEPLRQPAAPEPAKEPKMLVSKLETKSDNPLVLEKEKKLSKKKVTDPKQLLQKALKRKEKAEQKMKDSDNPDLFEKNQAIQSALAKASGAKLTDDIKLLKSAIKSRDKKKEKSRKEWGKRIKMVHNQKAQKQKKRADNIAKRKSKK